MADPAAAAAPLTTQALQAAHFAAIRQQPPHFDPREIRLSEAGQCRRRQTLRALGYTPAPPTDRELAIFETGHLAEDRIAALWAAQFPGQIQREVEVVTEYGTGHIDLYIPPANHLVECKTTTEKHLPDLPFASHVAQVTLYLHFWGNDRAATAEISYLLKETGEIRSYPVTYDRRLARDLVVGLIEVQVALTVAREPLPVPEEYQATQYPCAWYTAHGLQRCPFWDHCWGQRVSTTMDKQTVVALAPDLAEDVAAYAALRAQQQAVDTQLHIIKARRAQFEAGFRSFLALHGAQALRAGNITLKRAVIPGRTTTNLAAAIADGVVDPAVLAPYQTTSDPYDRWTVRQPQPSAQKED